MKAILVIDMPKGCCECNCAIDLCHGTIPSQEWYNKRPSWCPLRPLPEKKDIDKTLAFGGYENIIQESLARGYNACLEEITK